MEMKRMQDCDIKVHVVSDRLEEAIDMVVAVEFIDIITMAAQRFF